VHHCLKGYHKSLVIGSYGSRKYLFLEVSLRPGYKQVQEDGNKATMKLLLFWPYNGWCLKIAKFNKL